MFELERIQKKLEKVKKKVQLLKSQKPMLEKKLTQSIYANTSWQKSDNGNPVESSKHHLSPSALLIRNTSIILFSSKVTNGVRFKKQTFKNYAQVATFNVT